MRNFGVKKGNDMSKKDELDLGWRLEGDAIVDSDGNEWTLHGKHAHVCLKQVYEKALILQGERDDAISETNKLREDNEELEEEIDTRGTTINIYERDRDQGKALLEKWLNAWNEFSSVLSFPDQSIANQTLSFLERFESAFTVSEMGKQIAENLDMADPRSVNENAVSEEKIRDIHFSLSDIYQKIEALEKAMRAKI